MSEVFTFELVVARVLFGSNGSKIESSFGVEDVAESSSIPTADPWSEIFWWVRSRERVELLKSESIESAHDQS